jgi:hypothetical protein
MGQLESAMTVISRHLLAPNENSNSRTGVKLLTATVHATPARNANPGEHDRERQ